MLRFKILVTTCLLILLTNETNSQSGWFFQNSNSHNPIYDVFFVNSNTGFASGGWGLFVKTTNGGVTWSPQIIDSAENFNEIYFVSPTTGFVGCLFRIYKTTDGGNNWISITIDSIETVQSMVFVNQNTGFVGGSNGLIAKTSNSGSNWVLKRIASEYRAIISIEFININTGYALGAAGWLFKTTNTGLTWDTIYMNNTSAFMTATDFINNSTGYGIGGRRIFKTTNEGLNWNMQFDIPTISLMEIYFCDLYTGFAVGYIFDPRSSIILRTLDGGNNWSFNYSTTGFCLFSVQFIGKDTGYAVGGDGTNSSLNSMILKTTTGGSPIGIQPISSEVPDNFSLSQNYPNPFNPSTKIKFDIPPSKGARGMMVRLSIYDALGREISTLVNEGLKPGTYEVSFDGSNYPSGVYFYMLSSGGYIETKKMILLK